MTSTTASVSADDDHAGEELLRSYEQDAQLQGLTDDTLATYRSDLEYYLEWLDTHPLEIDYDTLRGFLHHLKNEKEGRNGPGLSDNTLNSYFSALNGFYKFLAFEDLIEENIVPVFRDRYLSLDQDRTQSDRQLISVEDMSMLVHSILDVRNKALVVLLAKTGIRRGECVPIDLSDIDWENQSIRLEDKAKRTNTTVFFDGECARVLKRWIQARNEDEPETDALFTNQYGERLQRNGIFNAVTSAAMAVDLHDPDATNHGERFTPHCCRHWFTTHLRRSGMRREFIQVLRGDSRRDAIDIYDHIDEQELRESYIAHIPTLGI
jgi:integrase/recombinase XerD